MVLWGIVSFTGMFSTEFLTQVADKTDVGASQPDESNVGASQPDVTELFKALTQQAVAVKGALRFAHHLARRREKHNTSFTSSQMKLPAELDSGRLRAVANHAEKAFGHGR